MGHRDGERTLLFFLAGWLQDLEADRHLSWSWMPLMFEDDDLDTKLEPVQTCQAGYFEVTHGGTFFFFGSTVSNQLFISSFITEPVFAKRYKVEHSDISLGISWFSRERHCILCIHSYINTSWL